MGQELNLSEIPDEDLKAFVKSFLKKIRNITDESQRFLLLKTAEVLAEFGRIEAALDVVKNIPDEDEFAEALIHIVEKLAEAGKICEAIELVKNIPDEEDRLWAMMCVAEAIIKTGRTDKIDKALDEALEIVRNLPDKDEYSSTLSDVAEIFARIGRIDAALEIARDIPDEEYHLRALIGVAEALIDSGKTERANQILDEILELIKGGVECPWVLVDIARTLAMAGRIDDALKVARDIPDEESPLSALVNVAEVLIDSGKMEKANEVLDMIMEAVKTDKKKYPGILAEAAAVLAEAGRIRDSLEVAKNIRNTYILSKALSRISEIISNK
ncbi:MAG: tetratricopeptide repeat protein [Archaeoglobaceae archaeon]